MRYTDLQKVIKEAERFLEKAKDASARIKMDNEEDYYNVTGTKESAACKRASLDLSKSLSEFRKS